jgi:hypothetical protein
MKILRGFLTIAMVMISILVLAQPALAFCGFYVAKADSKLFNQASQVIIARDENRTVLTMANDYQGEVKDFALVVPVPVLLKQEQVHVGDPKILERLDAFSAPRLVEYFDENPCAVYDRSSERLNAVPLAAPVMSRADREEKTLGVTVEAKFTVGEYDILILSAKESDGLETWLNRNGYKIPKGASQLLQPYIRQNMKFFVAKVNLGEFAKTGFTSLRPLMMAYESPKFMLPIRLGMINAQGEQDLIVYLLSPKGQTELTNYREVKVPSNVDIPEFVKQEFTDFYKSMFQTAYSKEGKKVAFVEYAWNMASCDPCSADPLNPEELKKAGVFWHNLDQNTSVFLTRLHVRYTRDKFPEDLQFQETANQEFFQGRYVIRHPFKGKIECEAMRDYQQSLKVRQEKEAQTVANLTGWKIEEIRRKANLETENPSNSWWRTLW